MDLKDIQERIKDYYPGHLGLRFTELSKDCVKAELDVVKHLCTTPDILHGGAIMSLADTLGAFGTVMNLPGDAAGTTTIESKTNFFRAVPCGTTATAVSTPLHRGKRTMVWQTQILTQEGKLAALVTQTQMVLYAGG